VRWAGAHLPATRHEPSTAAEILSYLWGMVPGMRDDRPIELTPHPTDTGDPSGPPGPDRTAADAVRAYWAACAAADWVAFGGLLTSDVVYELPQTRERIRGRERYVRFNAEYPQEWSMEVVRVLGEGRHASSWTRFTVAELRHPAVSFFELDEGGLISRITDFWPEPYEPPPGREHLVDSF
jgi:ketosteroid isomerase-like protein